jgi:hypothetical protein
VPTGPFAGEKPLIVGGILNTAELSALAHIGLDVVPASSGGNERVGGVLVDARASPFG